jgi:hypothetical protein
MTQVRGATRLLFFESRGRISPEPLTPADGKLRIVRVGMRTLIHRDEVERLAKNVLPFMNPQ